MDEQRGKNNMGKPTGAWASGLEGEFGNVMVAAFGLLASIRHHTGSLFVFATRLNLACFESEFMSEEVWIRRRDSSGVYLGTGSKLDLGTKNGVLDADRRHLYGPERIAWPRSRQSAGRDAGGGLLGDNTGSVVLAVAEPVFATNGHSNACRCMGGNRSPEVCIGQDRGGIAVGKGKETMSRKAKRYFGTEYPVRIKVAVSLNRVSRWIKTWQVRAILMTIFSIRLRAASRAGL
ncbi:hypothetical protein BDP81DRAFT_12986 [Colletotrichum phormii]|uniref:Uncharacterized protein n=1 Tax=Colletotrichum phormii TaxID=359342 RepID=A0AAJ0ENZ7_9PEZI|nr:uncharacterized protein BDP81DRAFT_12986 [Colletotrichum phormii]KAK1655953.1 hypothetical protein BDP81DRAFT_12986 [Colletotrichum phormii]